MTRNEIVQLIEELTIKEQAETLLAEEIENDLEGYRSEMRDLEYEYERAQEKVEEWEDKYRDAEARVEALEEELLNLKDQLANMRPYLAIMQNPATVLDGNPVELQVFTDQQVGDLIDALGDRYNLLMLGRDMNGDAQTERLVMLRRTLNELGA